MFAILKSFEKCSFMSLIFFALIHWPLTALNASGPKCCEKKILFEKISKFVKSPKGSHLFSFV